jgi:magnesium transporter
MQKTRKLRRSRKSGMAPGSLVHVGDIKTERPEITLIEYQAGELREKRFASIAESRRYEPSLEILWLNVYGLHEPEVMAEIGRRFNLHPLVLEDILNTEQRPKVEDYGDYLYVVARFFDYDAATKTLGSDQVSLVIGRDFVLTFQERRTGSFDPIRERLRADKGQIRKSGADYLAYSLLDAIVDRYFMVLEQLGEALEHIEDQLMHHARPRVLEDLHLLKRETLALRRAVWPLREVVNGLQRGDSAFFKPDTLLYLRDVYDHTVYVIESLESMRDLIAGMLDIYLSTVSNRLNAEVRALTAIATMLLPAALIAGIFGMNFREMPLIDSPVGFPIAIATMVGAAAVMTIVFWLRRMRR